MLLAVSHRRADLASLTTPLLIVPVGSGPMPEAAIAVDRACDGALSRCYASGDFRGARDETALVYGGGSIVRVLLVGMGARDQVGVTAIRRAAMIGGKRARVIGAGQAAMYLPASECGTLPSDRVGQAIAEGVPFGAWHFADLKRPPEVVKAPLESCEVITDHDDAGFADGLTRGNAIAAGQAFTRGLQVLPGNTCTPAYLGDRARELGERHGISVTVFDRAAIVREKMLALLAVGQGSAQEPRFIILEHKGSDGPPIVLVGKGVTFDSGGISIKPAQNMEEMKYDMSGAAAVLGTFETIGRLKPKQHIIGLVPSCENMPSSTSYKPGDVVGSHLGKTIEVVNTDAEGRLILADALSWAHRYNPAAVIDCATLTGAIVIGLGHTAGGLMGTDRQLIADVLRAGEDADERVWELPIWDEYRELIKSDIADMKNSGGRPAGSITAGWFLREFAEGYPWAHVDIAGTAYTERDLPTQAKGPTGVMVRLFAELLRARLTFMRMPAVVLLTAMLVAVGATAARAQDPLLRARVADSLRLDSLHADSLRRADTATTTDRLLKAETEQRVQLQPLPLPGTMNVQPLSVKYLFTRDSIDWVAAFDVPDLLSHVPGVYVERGGWIASPALIDYLGRGASSVEYWLDGAPLAAVGIDSAAVDPSIFPLSELDRIEVVTSPSLMQVFLFTRRHDRASPRTGIGVGQGDQRGAARYSAQFERRYPSGIGLSLFANYVGINPVDNAAGSTGGAAIPGGFAQLSYAPTPRLGMQAQLVTEAQSRNLLLADATAEGGAPDTLARQQKGTRTDEQLRLSWRRRDDGMAGGLDLFAARSAWSSDSMPAQQAVAAYGGIASYREPTWSAQLTGWYRTRWTPVDGRLNLGWTPTASAAASLEAVAQRHDGDRQSQWLTARVSYQLPFGFQVGGSISDGHRVQTPSILTDPVQRYTDAEVTAGYHSRRLTIDAGLVRNDGWLPQAYPEFTAIATLAPLPQTNWATAHVRLAPVNFLTFETVYQHPLSQVLVDATPPQHALSTATLRSKFWRNFPSGVFDLKLQLVVESWSPGLGGRDASGAPIVLPGATFVRGVIQFQIGPFIAYYDRVNLGTARTGYVPRYQIQQAAAIYGIRWEFSN